MSREAEVTEVTEFTQRNGETEKNNGEWRATAGRRSRPARNDKKAGNANAHVTDRLCFRSSCRCVTRFAGLSRAAALSLRSSSVSPFLRVISVVSVLSVVYTRFSFQCPSRNSDALTIDITENAIAMAQKIPAGP